MSALIIDPEKEKLLQMPTTCQSIVNNNYFTFKSLAKMIFPQKRLSIMLTVSTLYKNLLTEPNISQGPSH